MGIYIFTNKGDNKSVNFKFKNSTIIKFESSNSLNSTENSYTLSCEGNAGIWVTVDSTQKELTFSFTPKKSC